MNNHEITQANILVAARSRFISAFNELAEAANTNAHAKGFYEDLEIIGSDLVSNGERDRWLQSTAKQAAIARMHEELSEALDAVRKGNPPDDHLPQYSGLEAELADVIIRIMDMTSQHKLDVAGAVVEKMLYNAKRPHKHNKNS